MAVPLFTSTKSNAAATARGSSVDWSSMLTTLLSAGPCRDSAGTLRAGFLFCREVSWRKVSHSRRMVQALCWLHCALLECSGQMC